MNPADNEARLARLLAVLRKGLGHEMANQLVAVQGLARLVEQEEGERLSAEGRAQLARVAAGAAKAHALAGALADVARLAGPPAPAERVDLAELVAEVVAEAKQLAAGRRTEYHASVQALALSVSRPALRKVLAILLRRTAGARVEVTTRPIAEAAEICIVAEGSVFSPESAGRAFEPFTGPEGQGLDLFLARELAEGWGGSLRLEPAEDGAGTVFVVTCPLVVGCG